MKIEIKDLIETEKIIKALSELPDYRKIEEKIEYAQRDVLFGVLCSMFAGNSDMIDMHNWLELNYNTQSFKVLIGKEKEEIKVPSYSTMRRMIINVNSTKMEELFRAYFIPKAALEEGGQLAIDGKMMNGSGREGEYQVKRNSGMLNGVETKSKIIIAHKEIGSKKSEIPSFQEILKMKFSDKPFLYTFDALNTQKEGLESIHQSGDRYLAKVKGNQKTLQKQIIETFEEEYKRDKNSIVQIKDKRESIEGNKWVKRETFVLTTNSCNIILFNTNFNHIKTIIKQIKYTTDKKGKEIIKEQYLIANFSQTADFFQKAIKDHWICETYHYHKDMLTDEDDCKLSINPFGLSIFRTIVVNCIQLYLNKHKPQDKRLIMAKIYRSCRNNPYFLGKIDKFA
jgi:predicted transposase YbfD/YdcC